MKGSAFSARRLGAVLAVAALGMGLAPFGVNAAAPDSEPGKDSTNIVGGVAASQDEFPFMVSLQRDGEHFCGGSLLNAGTVLTAAHCVNDLLPPPSVERSDAPTPAPTTPAPPTSTPSPAPTTPAPTTPPATSDSPASRVTLVIGRTKLSDTRQGVVRKIAFRENSQVPEISMHPQYGKAVGYDAALIYLNEDVSGIVPVRLPTGNTDSLLAPGSIATVIGWGNMDTTLSRFPDRLHKVDVPILSEEECLTNADKSFNPKSDICAGRKGKDSCQGDSGGPLLRKIPGRDEYFQIGIVSWGSGCADQGGPGFYTSVSSSEVMDGLKNAPRGKLANALR
ncbi:Trypsin [Austwickia chelonae]|uniref:Putative peptidase n=1 Tax=Austwickia chelonae NBRC 105200 TaxID=1184607 RepID=K6W6C1_9MICO|nr:serine protease [Austwickia chelonae]GAB77377.1 putative peptidase [Austwickia chelonae NBRC 105200]SEW09056.1 Trypsin [Austwickia chelonae]